MLHDLRDEKLIELIRFEGLFWGDSEWDFGAELLKVDCLLIVLILKFSEVIYHKIGLFQFILLPNIDWLKNDLLKFLDKDVIITVRQINHVFDTEPFEDRALLYKEQVMQNPKFLLNL